MTEDKTLSALTDGEVLEANTLISLAELCRACQTPAERIFELVEEGIIEPTQQQASSWYFRSVCIRRVRCAQRLVNDLGVNTPGAALALELLEEVQQLREQLLRLEETYITH